MAYTPRPFDAAHLRGELVRGNALSLPAQIIVVDDLGACRAELAALRARAERSEDILSSLTVGGSEFYRNPERCAENIRQGIDAMAGIRAVLGRKLDAAEARVALLEGLLREMQWVPLRISYPTTHEAFRTCPVCGVWWLDEGEKRHLADCRLAAALADGG